MITPVILLLAKLYSDFDNPILDYQDVKLEVSDSNNDNIILIIADDLGINDINLMKKYNISQGISELEKSSVIFRNAYAGHSTCSPSRAALLSGISPTKLGFEFTSHPIILDILMSLNRSNILNVSSIFTNVWNKNLPKVDLISNELKKQGYNNYYIGKWHLGDDNYRPNDRGYDHSLSFDLGASKYGFDVISAKSDNIYDKVLNAVLPFGISHNGKKMFRPNKYMTDYLTDKALDVLDSSGFFLTLSYNAPHNPYEALLDDYNSINEEDHDLRVYLAMLKALDRGIYKIITKLKETNKYDNTMIIFTSDNGATHLLNTNSNHPYKGYKCTFYEGGLRVPLIISYPKKFQKQVINQRISHLDLFNIMKNKEIKLKEEDLFYRSGFYKALYHRKYKIKEYLDHNYKHITKVFDLNEDPREGKNIQDRKLINYLKKKLDIYDKQSIQPIWYGPTTTLIKVENESIYWQI